MNGLKNEMEWIDVIGPRIRTISSMTAPSSDYCIMDAVIAPGVFIPLHSHDDRETFYILSGAAEGFLDGRWHRLEAGDILDIEGGEKHAWRNASGEDAHLLLITTMRMKQFFDEIGRPVSRTPAPLSPDALGHLLEVAKRYGYWLATPQENVAIGISL